MPTTPTIAETLKHLHLEVYTASWCSDCRRLTSWIEREGIAVEYVDIEADAAAADRLVEETGKRAIPFILVNGKTWVRGYHKELPVRFDPDLLVRELLAAG